MSTNWEYGFARPIDSSDDQHHLFNYYNAQQQNRHFLHPDQGHSGRSLSSAGRGGSLAKFINDRRTSVISVATSIWHNRKTSVTSATGSPNVPGQNRTLQQHHLQHHHHHQEADVHSWENYPLPPPSVTRQLAFGASDLDHDSAPLGKTVLTAGFLAKVIAVLFVLVCVLAVVLLRLKEFDLDQKLLDVWNSSRMANVTWTSTAQSTSPSQTTDSTTK